MLCYQADDMLPHAVLPVHGNGRIICLDAAVQLLRVSQLAPCLQLASFQGVHFLQCSSSTFNMTWAAKVHCCFGHTEVSLIAVQPALIYGSASCVVGMALPICVQLSKPNR